MNIPANSNSKTSGGDLVASVPKDHLRSLFYLFAGKPDSRIKIFSSPISVAPEDIVELNDCIVRKLSTHHIDLNVTSVKVGYSGSQFNEFSTWLEFESHRWQEPEKVEELVIKWDFLVNIRDYAAPQRHTLLLRISRDFKPSQIFHMLGAGNADELDKLDELAAPAFCRVDFINAQISKELITVVEDWYKARRQPKLINPTLFWLKKRKSGIAAILDQWFLLSWVLLVVSFFYWGSKQILSAPTVAEGAIATIIGIYTLNPIAKISQRLGAWVFRTLAEVEGSKVVFSFTSGDKKRIDELEAENQKQGRKFIAASLWNITLNVVAGVIYAYLFSKGGA
ncbi:hypothetical protein [Xanthomonas sontii]|uniref:hypothetical protein n=1 Tax=Xanthomonas sontii TaxID=2650745 RepID=UPI00123DA7A9|nr:hypothetical protein [Xanthomonas sontii]